MVSIGGGEAAGGGDFIAAKGSGQTEVIVTGAGRHRLLSVLASVLHDSSMGSVLLKSRRARIDPVNVANFIHKFDLISSYALIAFHNRNAAAHTTFGSQTKGQTPIDWSPLPVDHFGSIDDGIMLSRAVAVVILQAASEEADLYRNETIPAACSEHVIFSDAWLCWCAAELDIPALEAHFIADVDVYKHDNSNRTASSSLYRKLQRLYEQQRISASVGAMPPFTEETTLGFQYFMQTLVFHVVSGPRILNIMDDDDPDCSLFWDSCCSRLLIHYMMYPVSVPSHASLHLVLERNETGTRSCLPPIAPLSFSYCAMHLCMESLTGLKL